MNMGRKYGRANNRSYLLLEGDTAERSINRNIVECKEPAALLLMFRYYSINRNIVECKA